MMQNKKIIGITGGSGCGKSYLSRLLEREGIPVIDADKTAHEVMNSDEDCILELCDAFGADIYSGGALDRKRLGEIVFSKPSELQRLNEISHKYILKSINNKIGQIAADIVCVDGAVLIESGFVCDMMIGVLADFEVRKNRITERDKISKEAAAARISAQKEDSFYRENCDFVIDNNGGEPDIKNVLKRITE